ncbi:MAG: fumarylacetoacetate hydrolase family protein [Sphaerochaetaceae bacterium]
MKYVRFSAQGQVRYGILDGSDIRVLDNSYLGTSQESGETIPLQEVRLLAPTLFSKAVCIGLNYKDHAKEFQLPIPSSPVVFIKPSTSILDPEGVIDYPSMCHRLDYEAELAVVIGRTCHKVSEADASSYILGYTCANDVTARDLQPKEGQWTIAKSFDTFCPLGPFIETAIDPSNLAIESRVDGKVMQRSNTSNLIFPVPYLVSFLSQIMTLLPGDIISTGTPGGISGMRHGATVEIIIEGLGTLRNTIG